MKCCARGLARFLLLVVPAIGADFYHDIAPIVYRSCSPCHKPGESAPFPLLSYDDVKRHAQQIASVTKPGNSMATCTLA